MVHHSGSILAFLVAGASLWAQPGRHAPATFCAGQDQIFARNFDLFGVMVPIAASVIIPGVLTFMRARWWWMTRWFRRGVMPVGALVVVILTAAIGLPWFAIRGVLPPEVGLIAYGGVDAQYLACTDESFRCAGVAFGLFGPQRGALVYNPGLLILAVVGSAALGILTFSAFFVLTRRMKGLGRG